MNDQIGAVFKWPLNDRSPGVIANTLRAGGVGKLGRRADVGDLEQRIGWRFDPDKFGVVAERRLHLVWRGHVHEICRDAAADEQLAHQFARSVINVSWNERVIAWPEGLEHGASR